MHRTILLLLLLLLALPACAGDEETPTPPPPSPTSGPTATPRPSATPRPTATATATPEPQPAIEAVSQSVDENGALVASRVFALTAGWLVVYADDGGEPGEVLAHAAVRRGEQRDVTLTVDPYLVTPTLHFLLHADDGEEGDFEFPDGDEPLMVGGEPVATTVSVDLLVTPPAISVADQALGENSTVVVEHAGAAAPGWMAVQADVGGEPGRVLGVTPVDAGNNEDVVVRIDWRNATRPLHAVLYSDGGEEGRFEPQEGDDAVQVRGQVVQAAFVVQGPPDIYAINQPVVAPEIVIERVYADEAGWIAVFSNFQGFTDRLLGHAAVQAGENLLVTVPVVPGNSTDVLHLQLHSDTGSAGEFDYPAADPAVLDEGGQPVRVSIETDTGNYLVTRDQPLGEDGEVEVPLVVSDLDAWVVVWTAPPDATGATGAPGDDAPAGEIVGQTLIERGVQRDVRIAVSGVSAGDTVYVVLQLDGGELGEFEFPGPDEILRRERAVILSPILILE